MATHPALRSSLGEDPHACHHCQSYQQSALNACDDAVLRTLPSHSAAGRKALESSDGGTNTLPHILLLALVCRQSSVYHRLSCVQWNSADVSWALVSRRPSCFIARVRWCQAPTCSLAAWRVTRRERAWERVGDAGATPTASHTVAPFSVTTRVKRGRAANICCTICLGKVDCLAPP